MGDVRIWYFQCGNPATSLEHSVTLAEDTFMYLFYEQTLNNYLTLPVKRIETEVQF